MAVFENFYNSVRNKTKTMFHKRYIRLSEHLSLRKGYITPNKEQLRSSDVLINKRYLFRTDKYGFILPSEVHQKPDLKVVFLGGSSTECAFVEESSRFPYLAGRIIERNTKLKVNAYNSGVSYSNSFRSINILLNKILPLKCHIVVIMFAINEVNSFLFEGGYFGNDPFSPREVISGLLKEKTKGISPQKDKTMIEADTASFILAFRSNLNILLTVCMENKILPVLMTEANRITDTPEGPIERSIKKPLVRFNGMNYETFKEIYDKSNQAIRDTGKEKGAEVIDLARFVPQNNKYLYDAIHYNSFGAKFAAEIIAKELEKLLS